ncbi:MAG: thiolase family protein [Fimbriimonadaceae bacterium]|nr:thiolase family protein [Fimbriimonadaceae bacterium]
MTAQGAIVGLGITEMTRSPIGDNPTLAARAIKLALEDAGLQKSDLDGLLVNAGSTGTAWNQLGLQTQMGLRNLKLMNHMNAAGSTAGQMVHYAAMAIQAGMATTVACVFADAPLMAGQSAGSAYARPRGGTVGLSAITSGAAYGFAGANTAYALAARRHMALYGTTNDQLGAIAVSNRKWAAMNPRAIKRDEITLEDYHNSRWICEPFHLLDCTMVNNGAIAVIVTSADRAADITSKPAYIVGMGQGHPGNPRRDDVENEVNTGAQIAKTTAFGMAGITVEDVDVCELYDCYTYTTLVTLEDYGFCKKGEGGAFVADGRLEPGGSLPTNTGGGELSGYYMWGMTPLSEGVIQARGDGGERQVPKHDVVLVSMQGGILDYHATLVLSPHRSVN